MPIYDILKPEDIRTAGDNLVRALHKKRNLIKQKNQLEKRKRVLWQSMMEDEGFVPGKNGEIRDAQMRGIDPDLFDSLFEIEQDIEEATAEVEEQRVTMQVNEQYIAYFAAQRGL